MAVELNHIRRATPVKAELRSEKSPKQPRPFTDVIATTVHAVRGQVKAIADACGVPEGVIYRVADINDPAPLKAFQIPAFVRETRSFAILDWLEAQVGRVAFQLPAASSPDHADVVRQVSTVVKEFGEALAQVSASIEDGTITDAERRAVDQQVQDVHRALVQLTALVARKASAA